MDLSAIARLVHFPGIINGVPMSDPNRIGMGWQGKSVRLEKVELITAAGKVGTRVAKKCLTLNKGEYMKKRLETSNAIALMVGIFAFFACGLMETMAQQVDAPQPEVETPQPSLSTEGSEFVTINVKDANISEVLKAYSLQTGQSIVVGPDVVSENVNVRLNNIPWQEALDVILKPYGFGYRVVGDTIVISKLENIVTNKNGKKYNNGH